MATELNQYELKRTMHHFDQSSMGGATFGRMSRRQLKYQLTYITLTAFERKAWGLFHKTGYSSTKFCPVSKLEYFSLSDTSSLD
jgi:hypothetical protein